MDNQRTRKDSIDRRSIDLDSCTSPVIIASLIGKSEPMLDKLRSKGYLPQNTATPLAEVIRFYVKRLESLSTGKAGELVEQKIISSIKLELAKTEKTFLDMKIARGEFVEIKELVALFEPIFYHIQNGLHDIARDYPIVADKIVGLTKTWNKLGEEVVARANKDGEEFVETMMNQEVETESSVEDLKELFGIYE